MTSIAPPSTPPRYPPAPLPPSGARAENSNPSPHRRRRTPPTSRGEPMVWLTGGMVAFCLLMILVLLLYIFSQGFTTFWPKPLTEAKLDDGRIVLGEPTRVELFQAGEKTPVIARTLYKTGNFDLTGTDFIWVDDPKVLAATAPEWGLVIERTAWLNAYGTLEGIEINGEITGDPAQAWAKFQAIHRSMRDLIAQVEHLDKHEIGGVSEEQNEIRLQLKRVERTMGLDSPEYAAKTAEVAPRMVALSARYNELTTQMTALRNQANNARLIVRTSGGQLVPADRSKPGEALYVWQIVRAYPANQLGLWDQLYVYGSRWWEYLSDDPREANMEGGVFPAIVGTVLLTFIMILIVVPLGVIASIYLREYAKQGLLVSIVRISVNNLAGVPSIVYGVFGLGFFCYATGGFIDRNFYADHLPDPTVGKSALIWASLTLALLTLPVVIVSTEEALAAVPRSTREAAYACGASTWQMIWRTVLPRAMPGIMTGTILAIARGAGEVAPLMLVGAVKIAPELPISANPPFFGSSRSFLHLGFHIYDLGFQSRNAEAARSMVYTTTLLLILIIVLLNISAMMLRSRLRKTYATGNF